MTGLTLVILAFFAGVLCHAIIMRMWANFKARMASNLAKALAELEAASKPPVE